MIRFYNSFPSQSHPERGEKKVFPSIRCLPHRPSRHAFIHLPHAGRLSEQCAQIQNHHVINISLTVPAEEKARNVLRKIDHTIRQYLESPVGKRS